MNGYASRIPNIFCLKSLHIGHGRAVLAPASRASQIFKSGLLGWQELVRPFHVLCTRISNKIYWNVWGIPVHPAQSVLLFLSTLLKSWLANCAYLVLIFFYQAFYQDPKLSWHKIHVAAERYFETRSFSLLALMDQEDSLNFGRCFWIIIQTSSKPLTKNRKDLT